MILEKGVGSACAVWHLHDAHGRGWNRMIFKVPSSPNQSGILGCLTAEVKLLEGISVFAELWNENPVVVESPDRGWKSFLL